MADLLLSQLEQGKPVKVEKDGKTICVARVGDEVFAVDDTCSHSDASLSEGEPLHTYGVHVDGDSVTVEI